MTNVQNFSYHTHTLFSDGADSLEDMVKRAKKIGFTHIGLSDHLIVHKDFYRSEYISFLQKKSCNHVFNSNFPDILDRFKRHCDEIRSISRKENFRILVGFEVDYFTYDGWEDELRDFLRQLDYDYLISGNHMFFDEAGLNVFDAGDLKKMYNDLSQQKEFIRRHFNTMKKAVDSGLFTFLAHLDYVRKVGVDVCSKDDFLDEKIAVLNSLENNGCGIEISTKGLRKINDFYPSGNILDEISKRNIPVVISDDAHRCDELGLSFDLAEKELLDKKIFSRLVL